MSELHVRFAGAGGQGIALAALLLADGAVRAGLHATHSQAYGPESRGGASRADVILSDTPIAFPIAARPDALIALTQESYDRYAPELAAQSLLLVDRDRVHAANGARALPIVAESRRVLGAALGANLVALGAFLRLSGAVTGAAVEAAIRARAPGGDPERALRAFHAGEELAQRIDREVGM